ncbi:MULTISPECIES: RES family NAD+ phosphorylase [Flavobacterium]|jgi:RES domain-containing protein|uniref:RES family NAD+ phosphorylase n=1 Tax=Flavobacterium cupriresistens TaxID=2893885 RepID=A0ABU4R6A4_9FLAO|nr:MULTISPECIES: RES family NAD+ phosphorylase [unclassified Flavobacterium]KLT71319.1 RES superfamily protein [Flavobacterium sp. ABG]MDX6188063.1 RES family NAD+ phosphorylase [Flavobacterium sp. Fl-318]UFH42017.1 RES family NAD+ phosphorylase [Flavobacterium sp. F-323]
MVVFRIEREKYLDATLKGIGASMCEGYRWNSLNTKMVYTAESRALATLEVSVHLDLSEDLPTDRFYVEIEIPDEITIQEVHIEDLPVNWDSKPPISVTQIIGDDFINYDEAAVLKVPSSIVPMEYNYLINPNHSDTLKIKVLSTTRMAFDSRFKSK